MNPTDAIHKALRALDANEVTGLEPTTLNLLRERLADGERALFDRAVELRKGYDELHDRVLRSATFAEASLGTAAFIHELRQCLSPLIGLSELMKETPDSPYAAEWVVEISSQAQRIADLLDRHAALLRNHSSHEEPCDIAAVVLEASRYFTRLPAGVKLETDVPRDLPKVMARRRQLLHALINLLANARDAQKGRPGTIRVIARAAGERVELVIADQGSGVDPSIRERIFEPLFTTKDEEGTGLGLFLSRELLRPHGELTLVEESKVPEGARTAFAIRLPTESARSTELSRAATGLVEVARAQPAELDPWTAARGRALAQLEPMVREERNNPVLLVEDEPAVRRMTRAVLESVANIKIYEAADAAFALKLLEKVQVDFLVCDKNLPDEDGLAVIRKARQMYPAIDAMVVTGYPSPDSAVEAIRVGATDYLLKPVREVKTLRESVGSALARQKLQRLFERGEKVIAQTARDLLLHAGEHQTAKDAIAAVLSMLDLREGSATRVALLPTAADVATPPEVERVELASADDLASVSGDIDLVLFGAESTPEAARAVLAAARARPSPPHLVPVGRFTHTETAVAAIQGRPGVMLDRGASYPTVGEGLQTARARRRREIRGEALRVFLKELGLTV